jgi:hypothetical protein
MLAKPLGYMVVPKTVLLSGRAVGLTVAPIETVFLIDL